MKVLIGAMTVAILGFIGFKNQAVLVNRIHSINTIPFYVALKEDVPWLNNPTPAPAAPAIPPEINLWYGDDEHFGLQGQPQPQINILGDISNVNPGQKVNLFYTLNGGKPHQWSLVNNERLATWGDFNIEIQPNNAELILGKNILVLTVEAAQFVSRKTVVINVTRDENLPLPHTIHWKDAGTIDQVAQVVNGWWTFDREGIRVVEVGYDRIIALGDIRWKDYEVSVPVTIHRFQATDAGGVGIVVRWQGYFQEANEQLFTGWWRIGGYGYYRHRSSGDTLAIRLGKQDPDIQQPLDLDLEEKYWFKFRVEGNVYRLKVWDFDRPEPPMWNLAAEDQPGDLETGSVLLVANKVDVTFGDVTVNPVAAQDGG